MITTVTDSNFKDEVLGSGKTAVLDFYADWCGPCKMLSPVMNSLSEKHPDIKFCKTNVDENAELAVKFGVSSIPMVAVFKDGEMLDAFVGYRSEEEVEDFIRHC